MDICIGIISYLPDAPKVRKARFTRLLSLLAQCDRLFHLPVIIIAQNYTDAEIKNLGKREIYRYDKLGITGARNALREKFLASKYDYVIMLDDDVALIGNSSVAYLTQIKSNPDCFIEFSKTLLKLFAISKYCFKEVGFAENMNPEKGEGFEDRLFVNTLRVRFPDRRREFINTGLRQSSISTGDPLSTWYSKQDLKDMIHKTQERIEELK